MLSAWVSQGVTADDVVYEPLPSGGKSGVTADNVVSEPLPMYHSAAALIGLGNVVSVGKSPSAADVP